MSVSSFTHIVRVPLHDAPADDQEFAKIPRDVHRVSRRGLQPSKQGLGLVPVDVHLRRKKKTRAVELVLAEKRERG